MKKNLNIFTLGLLVWKININQFRFGFEIKTDFVSNEKDYKVGKNEGLKIE